MTSDEIKKAMREFLPVQHNGIKYRRISAYIFRIIAGRKKGTYKEVLQVELEDYNGHSVTLADPAKVELTEQT